MTPELKAKWIAALRSGKWVQGRETLRRANDDGINEFCCLGVLCEVIEANWEETYGKYRVDDLDAMKLSEFTDLPPVILDLIGMSEVTQGILVHMNDGKVETVEEIDEDRNIIYTQDVFRVEPKSFSQIADWLEANEI